VTRQSDALDLDRGVFKQTSARKIAASLKRSAERSKRREAPGYRSALFDADLLYQSRWQEPAESPARPARARQVELKRQFGKA
jgi:hypothetical protein